MTDQVHTCILSLIDDGSRREDVHVAHRLVVIHHIVLGLIRVGICTRLAAVHVYRDATL